MAKEIDSTKIGPLSYRQLQQKNKEAYQKASTSENNRLKDLNIESNIGGIVTAADIAYTGPEQSSLYKSTGGEDWVGRSQYDPSGEEISEGYLSDVGQYRAENQPWYDQIANGVAKGVVLAGTTFVSGTAGLLYGIGSAINNNNFSKVWDNDFEKALQEINDYSEKNLANYYSHSEEDGPWYNNIFTANFIGDKFLKNLGFTAGAFYSGGLYSKGLGAILKIAKAGTTAGAFTTSVVGSAISAFNEGRIEALNNTREKYEAEKTGYSNAHQGALEQLKFEFENSAQTEADYAKYLQGVKAENELYNQTLGKLEEARARMGNMDLLMNLPLLTAGNLFQFGKLLSRGAGYAMIRDATKPSAWKSVGKAVGRVASEAHEEMAQAGIANIAGKYHFSDPEAFYKSKGDPEYSKNTMSFLQAAMQGTMETLSTPSVWEEGFIGGLTGFMGMPRFRGFKNKQGQFQSPIVLEEGVGGIVRDYFEQKRNYAEVDAYIQKRISDPKFVHAYQSVSRHNAYQDMMDKAVEEGDTFEYKNAEQSQMVSDIIMFARAGRLDELRTMIKNGFDTSDQNLQEMLNNSNLVKPTGEKYNLDDAEDKKEVIDIFTKNQKKILDAVDEYTEVYSNLMSTQGAKNLSAEQREELTWMQMQINNFDRRGKQLSESTKETVKPLINILTSQADRIKDLIAEEQKKESPDKAVIAKHENTLKNTESFIQGLNKTIEAGVKGTILTDKIYQPFIDNIISNLDLVKDAIDPLEYEELKKSFTDLKRLNQARADFSSKLNEYLGNPSKQLADHERSDRENSNKAKATLSNELREKLNNAKSVHEYEQILDEADEEERTAAEEELGNSEDENYKTYKSFKDTRSAIATNIVNSEADAATIEDAMNLWQKHSDSAENENALFENSEALTDPTEFSVDEEGNINEDLGDSRLANAKYLIEQEISKYKQDNAKRNAFSEPTTAPNVDEENDEDLEDAGELVINPKPTNSTGSDATPKIPESIAPKPVRQDKKDSPEQETSTKSATESESNSTKEQTNEYDETPTEVKEKERSLPIGDSSSENIINENDEISSDTQDDNTESLKDENSIYKFYAPTIPEIHIEEGKKGKNGDYRPFNVVVKEKEGKDYDVIYNYLKDNGAFKFLNEGKLKRGDTIHFMIDPKFEIEMRSKYDWYTGPTIFMTTDSGQVVGSLPSDPKVISRYKGLRTLTNKIKQEYEESKKVTAHQTRKRTVVGLQTNYEVTVYEKPISLKNAEPGTTVVSPKGDKQLYIISNNKDLGYLIVKNITGGKEQLYDYAGHMGGTLPAWAESKGDTKVDVIVDPKTIKEEATIDAKFIATSITKVSKIMVGKIPYTQTDQDLNTIPGAKNNLKFEIITNPNDKKRGRLYLLIPNGAGGTSRAAVRVKHFNAAEYDLNSTEVKESKMGSAIITALEKLNTATSAEDKSRALSELSKYIYLNDVIIKFNPAKEGREASITIARRLRNEDGTFVQTGKKDDNGNEIYATSRKLVIEINRGNDSLQEIIRVLQFYNLPFQVSAREINKSNYNKDIIEEGILFANISSAESLSTWFITDYIDDDGVRHSASKEGFGTGNIGNNDNTNTPINSKESTISGQSIAYNGSTYYVDGKIIRDKDGNNITNDLTENQKNLFNAIAWADECYNSEEDNGLELIDGKIKTPDGLYIDRKNQEYLTKNEIDEYEREFAERKKQAEGADENVGNINLDNEIDVDDTQDPNAEMPESKISYYEIEGKLHKGFVRPIGTVVGINISMIKQPIYDLNLSTGKKTLHVGNSYYIVLPNGNTVKVISKTKNTDYNAIAQKIISTLEKNPDKIKNLAESEDSKKISDHIGNNQENKYQNKDDKFIEPNDTAEKPESSLTGNQEQSNQQNSNTKKEQRIITKFEELTENEREILKGKGWTEEKFNSVSQIERDNAVACFII